MARSTSSKAERVDGRREVGCGLVSKTQACNPCLVTAFEFSRTTMDNERATDVESRVFGSCRSTVSRSSSSVVEPNVSGGVLHMMRVASFFLFVGFLAIGARTQVYNHPAPPGNTTALEILGTGVGGELLSAEVTTVPDAIVDFIIATETGSIQLASGAFVLVAPSSVIAVISAVSDDRGVATISGTPGLGVPARTLIAVQACVFPPGGAAFLTNRPDVYITDAVDERMRLLSPGLLAAVDSPYSVAIGDLNGDGFLDLAVANSSSNTVSVLLGTGGGAFAAATLFSVGGRPRSVAIGDLNGDGLLDLAVAQGPSGVSVLLELGAVSSQRPRRLR